MEQAVRILELLAPREGGLADHELVLVHEIDDRVGVRRLLDLSPDRCRSSP